jgi:hypothetical protein
MYIYFAAAQGMSKPEIYPPKTTIDLHDPGKVICLCVDIRLVPEDGHSTTIVYDVANEIMQY